MNTSPAQGHTGESRSHRLPQMLFAAYAVVWVLTAIRPFNRQDWLLENLLVFAAVPALVLTYPKFRFSNVSYMLMTVYFSLHALGAHYTYSEMPVFNWVRDDWQFSRNHYDRVVHFLFGLLISQPFWEVLVRVAGLRRGWARVGTVHVVMAWSAVYEMIEAMVAHLVSPELGAAYNGIQGDIWDAQKDAALAMVGAILTMTFAALVSRQNVPAAVGRPVEDTAVSAGQPAGQPRGKELALEAAVYVGCLSLVSFLWENPVVLLGCLGILSALMLWRWHERSDVNFYAAGFVLGPLGEMMAVHFGAWSYAAPLFLVPIWLPCLWGIAALFVKRLCETLLGQR